VRYSHTISDYPLHIALALMGLDPDIREDENGGGVNGGWYYMVINTILL